MGTLELTTARLTLRPASAAEVARSLSPPAELAKVAGPVSPDWPPRYWDASAVDWLNKRLAVPQPDGWYAWFLRLHSGLLIGTAGFTGPPSEGIVEIGYGLVESRWRQGFATEAVGALISWALTDSTITRIRAHTLRGDPASSGVLRKNGFAIVGQTEDPGGEGIVDRYERPR